MANDERIEVLLVDDDEAAFLMTRAILDQIPRAEFAVDWVRTVAEAEPLIAAHEHDIYLIDYMIGEDSGIDLVRRARASQNRAPMILLTGKGRYEVDVEAMEAGVSDYLDKTKIDPDVVERSIRYAIDRARSEAALRESEARHRSMFDHLPIGLFRTSAEGELLDANPALAQLLGHPDRDALANRYARAFFVEPARSEEFLERLEKHGVVRGFESELERPDGSVVHVRTAARSHRTENGTMVYIEGAVEDVSEAREAHDVHGGAARFRWVFEGSGLPIVLVTLEGAIRDANPAFLRAFGYRDGELNGRPLVELAEGDDRGALGSELAEVAKGERDTSEAERRLSASDGETLWARTRTGLVRSFQGEPDHLIVLFEDVAEA